MSRFIRIEEVEVLARFSGKELEEYIKERFCDKCSHGEFCSLNPLCTDGFICPYHDNDYK